MLGYADSHWPKVNNKAEENEDNVLQSDHHQDVISTFNRVGAVLQHRIKSTVMLRNKEEEASPRRQHGRLFASKKDLREGIDVS